MFQKSCSGSGTEAPGNINSDDSYSVSDLPNSKQKGRFKIKGFYNI